MALELGHGYDAAVYIPSVASDALLLSGAVPQEPFLGSWRHNPFDRTPGTLTWTPENPIRPNQLGCLAQPPCQLHTRPRVLLSPNHHFNVLRYQTGTAIRELDHDVIRSHHLRYLRNRRPRSFRTYQQPRQRTSL